MCFRLYFIMESIHPMSYYSQRWMGSGAEPGMDRCLPEQFLLKFMIFLGNFDKHIEIEHINC